MYTNFKEMTVDQLESILEVKYNDLENVKQEIDLFEEDYRPDLIDDKKELKRDIKKIEKHIEKLLEENIDDLI